MHRPISTRTTAILTGFAFSLSAAIGLAQDQSGNAHGNVRYIGDGTVTLGDGTRYKLPEGAITSHLKEGQHVTIQFKNGHNGKEITNIRSDE